MYTPARPLHSSSDSNSLSIAAARTKLYGQRAFAYQGSINQCYFHVTVSHFGSFVTIIYISLINTYYVLRMCCHFLLSTLSTMLSALSCLRLGAISSVHYYYYYYYCLFCLSPQDVLDRCYFLVLFRLDPLQRSRNFRGTCVGYVLFPVGLSSVAGLVIYSRDLSFLVLLKVSWYCT